MKKKISHVQILALLSIAVNCDFKRDTRCLKTFSRGERQGFGDGGVSCDCWRRPPHLRHLSCSRLSWGKMTETTK